MLVARVSVLVADKIRAKNFYSGKLNFAAGDHSATHHPRSSFAPRTFRSPAPSATAQFDVTWAAEPTPARNATIILFNS
jgi:hypothetical protein